MRSYTLTQSHPSVPELGSTIYSRATEFSTQASHDRWLERQSRLPYIRVLLRHGKEGHADMPQHAVPGKLARWKRQMQIQATQ